MMVMVMVMVMMRRPVQVVMVRNDGGVSASDDSEGDKVWWVVMSGDEW